MYKLNLIDKISVILVLIGALNWGLIGITNYNIVALIFNLAGESVSQILQRIVYILVGAAAVNILMLIYKSRYSKNLK
jgi:uncharacterized membrane protein YuzA (DUF378 family)